MKKLIVFDLDGTLAVSKSTIDDGMAGLLARLLQVARVAIISGGKWEQFEKQVLQHLPAEARLPALSILPTCGTQFYHFQQSWQLLYAENFTPEEKEQIIQSLQEAINEAGYTVEKTWGEQIEDRGSQITWSALGQEAPVDAKKTWDPDFSKRKKIQQILDKLIPGFAINLGGMTSVDITREGIDKAYGIHKLRDTLHLTIGEMLFVGDALFPGGNDYPAFQAGVRCVAVRDPEDTRRVTDAILACLGS
ncbi:HAD-IIB family hydrolase [Chitinophaga qingshengii]|uniref:phosphomannomutase n=1 Tax=Chitinophaga qingshengii TaxID=1569794 RepID=A0ABR7TQF6_9BACT|nr:HAD-IIB family hydrolase [Chitinophaga qingshengii]MBC9932205.1 HAD-IIB family hydrolase [Chitinophaga qingshengii]